MLIVDHLTIKYAEEVIPIKDLSFVLKKGEIGCILGLSGIGKSTLLKALGGILPPFEGSITIEKQPLSPSQQNIGYVSQDYGLYPWKTVLNNMTILNQLKNRPVSQKLFDDIVDNLGLSKLLSKYPHTLSGGEKQRVALARVFLFSPDLLLLDEPFSSLDEITRNSAQELLLDLWKKYQPTTILITHSIDEALKLGHYIFILKNNKIHSIYNPYFLTPNLEKMVSLKEDIIQMMHV